MRKVEVNCPFCQSGKKEVRWSFDEWSAVECLDCGLHYTNPRPSDDEIPFLYKEDYYKDERHRGKFYNEVGLPEKGAGNYSNRISDLENHFKKRGRILEIGAARGEYLSILQKRGWYVEGIEISSDGVEKAKSMYGLNLHCGTINNFKSEEKFDAIVMYQVLEHLGDPLVVMEKCRELLKPGGILIVEVPNIRSFDFRRSNARRRLMLDLPRHLVHYDKSSLLRLHDRFGFTVEEVGQYLPDFMVRFLARMENSGKSGNNSQSQNSASDIPMMRKKLSWKVSLLQFIAFSLPGWRITVISRKSSS